MAWGRSARKKRPSAAPLCVVGVMAKPFRVSGPEEEVRGGGNGWIQGRDRPLVAERTRTK